MKVNTANCLLFYMHLYEKLSFTCNSKQGTLINLTIEFRFNLPLSPFDL